MGKLSDSAFGGDLFTPPLARNSDPETSHQAAKRVTLNVSNDRQHVLVVHSHHPNGLTDYELAKLCDRQQNSVGKRRGELCEAGYIEKTTIKRPAPSGSPAFVWRITETGKRMARTFE